MILYLFVAPLIKDRMTIVEGKPVSVEGAVLEETDNIRAMVDRITEAKVDKQWVYRVQGWSYIMDDMDQANYDVFLVFTDQDHRYFFATTSYKRSDVESAFPEVEIDLTNSGFDMFIAKELMANGNYDVGLLYRNKTTGAFTYYRTDKILVKTINDIQLGDR